MIHHLSRENLVLVHEPKNVINREIYFEASFSFSSPLPPLFLSLSCLYKKISFQVEGKD